MLQSLRLFATAGVALTAAGAIAAAPAIAPTPPDIQVPRIAAAQVALAAETDFFGRWVEVFNTTSENATKVSQFSFEAPGAALQQAIVNQAGYFGDVLNDPASIGIVFQTFGENMQKAFNIATMQGLPEDINQAIPILALSNDPAHAIVVGFVPGFLPEGTPEVVIPLVHFLASPITGVMIGFAGPLISPAVAALNSIMAGDLLNLPANVVDGFFNGATLNLDALLPAINGAGVLPEGTTVNRLGIAFGGLFSPGGTGKTVGGPIGVGSVGGSIFNSVDVSITSELAPGFPITLDAPGVGIGPLGAMANLSQMIAGAIGWDGDGNPLTKLTFPGIETEPSGGAPSVLSAIDVDDSPAVLASKGSLDTDTEPAAAEEPAAEPAAEEGTDESGDAQVVKASTGATDLSDGNKAEPGKAGTTSSRPGEKLRTAVKEFRSDVRSTVKDVRSGIRAAVKNVSGGADKTGADDAGSGAESANAGGDDSSS
ncbi:outer membrane porin GjpA [Mycolicibacterium sp. XJ870]